jgi:hypothetical protein
LLTIMNFAVFGKAKAKKWQPRVVVLGKGNKIVDERGFEQIYGGGDLRGAKRESRRPLATTYKSGTPAPACLK